MGSRSTPDELSEAILTRWINGVNTQAPWGFVKAVIEGDYAKRFAPIPWYIGEYGANGQDFDTGKGDMESIQALAEQDPLFLGAVFFQFQVAYFKGGSEMNFGLFGLGNEKLGEIPANEGCADCSTKTVYCLTPKLFLARIDGHAGRSFE